MEIHKKIAIWGAGKIGEFCYKKMKTSYGIECFYDSDIRKEGKDVIEGVKVKRFEKFQYYIVIGTSYWKEVAVQLQEQGVRFLEDFIPYHLLEEKRVFLSDIVDVFGLEGALLYLLEVKKTKKIAIVYGNCQTSIIGNMLEYNEGFSNDYLLLRVPEVHTYRNIAQIQQFFYGEIINKIDCFIYQNVKLDNKYYKELATELICKNLCADCKIVRIHNIYFDGYFMQLDKSGIERNSGSFFPYCDSYIEQLWKNGHSIQQILECIKKVSLFDVRSIEKKCELSLEVLRKKERFVDVPIVDFIVQEYRKRQLFYTHNHPIDYLLFIYSNRILSFLKYEANADMSDEDLESKFGSLKMVHWLIYPCVIEALGMENFEKELYTYSVVDQHRYTFDEYVQEYINRCCR